MSLERFIKDIHSKECAFKMHDWVVQDLEDVVSDVMKTFLPKAIEMIPDFGERFSVQEVINAGSHFERTKIKAPDEYDFMVVFKELSEPGMIKVEKGCKNGYAKVKVIDQDEWGRVYSSQTPDKTFEIALLHFNSYLRKALLLTRQLSPFRSHFGELRFKNIVSRGKQYKEFSYVQTAYFRWAYKDLPSDIQPDITQNSGKYVIEDSVNLKDIRDNAASSDHGERKEETDTGSPDEFEIIYNRLDSVSNTESENEKPDADVNTFDLDVDLMACCHVPLLDLPEILPAESLKNSILLKNGCHIVLKPCGNSKCIENDTNCRLISYTKSEQELMRNLPTNWKIVYKVFKWLFGYTEMLGVDSYKLKTAVLHLNYRQDKFQESSATSLEDCMISMWKVLQHSSAKGRMLCFFNPTLNIWNISPYFSYIVCWEIQFLHKIFDGINQTPDTEYDYELYQAILDEWFIQFSDNNSELKVLETSISHSDFSDFCVQGNVFVDTVRGMEPILKKHKIFRNIAFQMKCRVLMSVLRFLSIAIFQSCWNLLKKLVITSIPLVLSS